MDADSEQAQDGQPKTRIFISYSRKDMPFADRLEAALKARGFEPLIDRTEIYAFEDWWKRIEALIARADTIVFVLSPDAVTSDVALKEIAYAATINKRFAPIVCRRVEDGLIPDSLRRLNFIFFDEEARFEGSADKLAEALQTDIGWIRQHTEFGEAARRWSGASRPGGLLLRSPVLEDAERWIASRPRGAPEPTAETRSFITESRRGTTRRRNILTGSLTIGLVLALGLAGLAYWQRGIAVEQQRVAHEQRQIAEQQQKRAEDTLAAATKTANGLVFDLALRFRDVAGMPVALIKDILDRARHLQDQLTQEGQVTTELRVSQAVALKEVAATLLSQGDTKGALEAAKHSVQIEQELVKMNPANTGWQRNLSVCYNKLGDVQEAQGDLAAALKSYQASLAIMERLAKSNPDNTGWQRDLSATYENIGEVQEAQGDLPAALKSYQTVLAIAERLAKSDPGNAIWQSDLPQSYDRVGDVQVEQGDLNAALKSYQASLTIAERLAKSDPSNTRWQWILSISYIKIGEVQAAQGDLPAALKSFQATRAIRERLAKSDPGNADWQYALGVSNERVGNLQMALGNLDGALKSYQTHLAIIERLTKADPRNTQWQTDLVVSLYKVSTVSPPAEARAALTRALSILEVLAGAGKLTADQQNWPDMLRAALAKLPPA